MILFIRTGSFKIRIITLVFPLLIIHSYHYLIIHKKAIVGYIGFIPSVCPSIQQAMSTLWLVAFFMDYILICGINTTHEGMCATNHFQVNRSKGILVDHQSTISSCIYRHWLTFTIKSMNSVHLLLVKDLRVFLKCLYILFIVWGVVTAFFHFGCISPEKQSSHQHYL